MPVPRLDLRHTVRQMCEKLGPLYLKEQRRTKVESFSFWGMAVRKKLIRARTLLGRKSLRQLFHLCEALEIEEDGIRLAEYIMTAFDSMAMGNFPYPSSYMTSGNGELPAWPVRAACSHLDIDFDASAVKVKGNQDQLLDALSKTLLLTILTLPIRATLLSLI